VDELVADPGERNDEGACQRDGTESRHVSIVVPARRRVKHFAWPPSEREAHSQLEPAHLVSRPQPDRPARLAYIQSYTDGNLWRLDLPGRGMAATSPPVVAVASNRSDANAQFAADGRTVTFMSTRRGWRGPQCHEPSGGRFDSRVLAQRSVDLLHLEQGQRAASLEGACEGWRGRAVSAGPGLNPIESPDGTYLYYGDGSVHYFDLATRRSTTIATRLEELIPFGIAASPDWRTILFGRIDASRNDLMLVENFR
jgi:dipeptidyl aminopeptidase/acylaminoacyl peptidase